MKICTCFPVVHRFTNPLLCQNVSVSMLAFFLISRGGLKMRETPLFSNHQKKILTIKKTVII